jgi:H+/Cl- antiporter ClcA
MIGLRKTPLQPHIHLFEALPLALVGLLAGLVGVAFAFFGQDDYGDGSLRWLVIPGCIWFAFGALSIVAWIYQRRLRTEMATFAPHK